MNKALSIVYLARHGETAWSPTGQPYRTQSLTEEGEQVAPRRANGLLPRDDTRQVGRKQSINKI